MPSFTSILVGRALCRDRPPTAGQAVRDEDKNDGVDEDDDGNGEEDGVVENWSRLDETTAINKQHNAFFLITAFLLIDFTFIFFPSNHVIQLGNQAGFS